MAEPMYEGVDYVVDHGVDRRQQSQAAKPLVRGRGRGATGSPRFSSLSSAQAAVLQAVTKHGQLTASQVRRLLYEGTPRGTYVRSSRHLKKLTELGLLRRFQGVYYGDAEYIYMPAGTTTRGPVFHTLDISELYVRLSEASYKQARIDDGTTEPQSAIRGYEIQITFDREPWCHIKVGHVEVKPDAYLKFNEQEQYFIEVDRSSADRTKLAKKLRLYVNLFESWTRAQGETFPQVIYTVIDSDRKRQIEGVAKTQRYPNLFKVMLFDEAVDKLTS